MNNIIINLLLRANLVRGFEGILNFMRVCLFFMHNDFIIITPTDTDCLWWESFQARQLWWEGGAAASTGRTSQIQGRSGRTTMRRRRCLRVRAIRRVWTRLGWGAWLFANWLRGAKLFGCRPAGRSPPPRSTPCPRKIIAADDSVRMVTRKRMRAPPSPRRDQGQISGNRRGRRSAEKGLRLGNLGRGTVGRGGGLLECTGFPAGRKGPTAGFSHLLSN